MVFSDTNSLPHFSAWFPLYKQNNDVIAGLSMAPGRLRVKGMSHESRDFVGLMSVVTLARLNGQICEFLRFLSSHPGLTFARQEPWPWEAFSLYLNWSWRKTSLHILIKSGYKRPFPWSNQILRWSACHLLIWKGRHLCAESQLKLNTYYSKQAQLRKLPIGKVHNFGKQFAATVFLICLRNRNTKTIHNVLI